MSASIEVHDIVVRQIFYQLKQLRVFAKEMLTCVGTAVVLVVLQFTVADLIHAFLQEPCFIFF